MLQGNFFTAHQGASSASPQVSARVDCLLDATKTININEYMYATMARKKAITRYCLVHCYVRMASLLLSSYVNVGMLHWNFFTSIRERAIRSTRARHSHDVIDDATNTRMKNEYMYAPMARKKAITRYWLIHCYVRIVSLLLSSYVNVGMLHWKF